MDLVEGDPSEDVVQLRDRARGLAQQRGGMFFEVSALRSTGIFEAFDNVCGKIFPDQHGGSSRPARSQKRQQLSGVVLGASQNGKASNAKAKINNCCD